MPYLKLFFFSMSGMDQFFDSFFYFCSQNLMGIVPQRSMRHLSQGVFTTPSRPDAYGAILLGSKSGGTGTGGLAALRGRLGSASNIISARVRRSSSASTWEGDEKEAEVRLAVVAVAVAVVFASAAVVVVGGGDK